MTQNRRRRRAPRRRFGQTTESEEETDRSIITAVDGTSTPTLADLQAALAELSPGQKVTVAVVHSNDTQKSYTVTLGSL
jgi:S1-C subfamily serine protease